MQPTTGASLPPITHAPVAAAPDCYLPVYWSTTVTSNTVHAGFFRYPEGGVQGDTSMAEGSDSDLFSGLTATYDRAVNRWLPVPAQAVSPDGLRFAFADYDLPAGGGPLNGVITSTGRVHIVDARTGAGHVVFTGSPTFSVVAFTGDGLYLAQVALTRGGALPSGLFLLDSAGGAPRPVAGAYRPLDQNGWQIEGQAAWGVDFASGGGHISGNRVLSLDLKTGAIQEWKTWPEGVLAHVLGLDAQGHLIVGAFRSSSAGPGTASDFKGLQVWTFSSPNVGSPVFLSTDPLATLPESPAFSDAQTSWLGGNSPPESVWRLPAGATLTRVPVAVAGSGWVGVGGACV